MVRGDAGHPGFRCIALAGYREQVGEETAEVARVLHLVGRIHHASKDAKGSQEANEQALKIRRKVLPEMHPDIGISVNNLGNARENLGAKDLAVESFREAIRIWKASLRNGHPLIAMGMNNLGNVQCDLRDYEGARKSHEEALAIRCKAKDHSDIADSLNNLGNVQRDLRDYQGARKSYEESLAIYRKTLLKGHPDIALSLNNLGVLLIASGKMPQSALPWLVEAVDFKQQDLTRLAIAQSESEQLRASTEARTILDLLLSLATLVGEEEADKIYTRIVGFEGAVTARQLWARRSRDIADPETVRLLAQLRKANRDIHASGRNVAELRDLTQRRARLGQDLAARSSAFRDFLKQARVGTAEVRAALPEATALIDLVDYTHVSPPAKGKKDPTSEQRVISFVVRPGPVPRPTSRPPRGGRVEGPRHD